MQEGKEVAGLSRHCPWAKLAKAALKGLDIQKQPQIQSFINDGDGGISYGAGGGEERPWGSSSPSFAWLSLGWSLLTLLGNSGHLVPSSLEKTMR